MTRVSRAWVKAGDSSQGRHGVRGWVEKIDVRNYTGWQTWKENSDLDMKIIKWANWFPCGFWNTLTLLFYFPSVPAWVACLGTGKEPELTVGSSHGGRVKLCGQLWLEGTSGAKCPFNVPIFWSCLEEGDLCCLDIHGLCYDGISLRPSHCHDGLYQGDGDLAHCDFVSFTYLPSWIVMGFVVGS